MNKLAASQKNSTNYCLNASFLSQQSNGQSQSEQIIYGEPVYQDNLCNQNDEFSHLLPKNQLQKQGQALGHWSYDSYAADPQDQQCVQNKKNQKQNQNKCFSSSKSGTLQVQTPTLNQEEHIHKVQHGDTLEGLSLIYQVFFHIQPVQVSIHKIKQRNDIDGDSIYYLKEIVIPNPQSLPDKQARTQSVIIEDFMEHMSYEEKSSCTARYYLEEANWEVEPALRAYKQDLEWERKNKIKIQSIPLSSMGQKSPAVNYYGRELQNKKQI